MSCLSISTPLWGWFCCTAVRSKLGHLQLETPKQQHILHELCESQSALLYRWSSPSLFSCLGSKVMLSSTSKHRLGMVSPSSILTSMISSGMIWFLKIFWNGLHWAQWCHHLLVLFLTPSCASSPRSTTVKVSTSSEHSSRPLAAAGSGSGWLSTEATGLGFWLPPDFPLPLPLVAQHAAFLWPGFPQLLRLPATPSFLGLLLADLEDEKMSHLCPLICPCSSSPSFYGHTCHSCHNSHATWDLASLHQILSLFHLPSFWPRKRCSHSPPSWGCRHPLAPLQNRLVSLRSSKRWPSCCQPSPPYSSPPLAPCPRRSWGGRGWEANVVLTPSAPASPRHSWPSFQERLLELQIDLVFNHTGPSASCISLGPSACSHS